MNPLFALAGPIIDLVGKAFGLDMSSDDAKAKVLAAEVEVQKMIADAAMAQTTVNAEEAKSSNMFVAGWRPAVGWVCALIFAYNFLIEPMLIFGLDVAGIKIDPPMLEMQEVMGVLMGMLGLGGMRTYEKLKDVSNKGRTW